MNRRHFLAVAALGALAGCTPSSDRVERSAETPATLSADGYEQTAATTSQFDATVEATFTGDVELNSKQPVTATVFIRRYTGPSQVSIVTSPAVQLLEQSDVSRDPLEALGTEDAVALALGREYALEEETTREVTLLGQTTTATVYTADGETVTVARVRDGNDFVTVVVVGTETEPVLSGVRHTKE